jgi:hypothetical protein
MEIFYNVLIFLHVMGFVFMSTSTFSLKLNPLCQR